MAEVSASHHVSGELLASRRQINQLLNWHWKLKPQKMGNRELIFGWRAELMAEKLTLSVAGVSALTTVIAGIAK